MVLEAFDDYFGGAPATKTINIEIVPEASSRAIALEPSRWRRTRWRS